MSEKHYEPIQPKEFASSIPPHLLEQLTAGERHFIEAISKQENQFAWTSQCIVANNKAILDLDKRVNNLEQNHKLMESAKEYVDRVNKLWDWKQLMTGKWGIIGIIATVLLSVLAKALLEIALK